MLKNHLLIKFGLTILFVLYLASPSRATTWYIRTDGGTATQCAGTTNAAYPGAGTGQPCALAHPFWLMNLNAVGWISGFAGGDTVLFEPNASGQIGTYYMGYDPSGTTVPNQNGSGNCYSAWPYDCHLPTVPAGSVGTPTRFLGANYATIGAARPKLVGIKGAAWIFGAGGGAGAETHDVDIQGLEITDGAACDGYAIGNAAPAQCGSQLTTDYASVGLYFIHPKNLTVKNNSIHGLASTGAIIGGAWGTTIFDYNTISGNGFGGLDTDSKDVRGGKRNDWFGYDNFNIRHNTIQWNGCVEAYPFTSYNAVSYCAGQNSGINSDGIGFGNNAGHVVAEDNLIRFNTQDGLDLLYQGEYLYSHPSAAELLARGLPGSAAPAPVTLGEYPYSEVRRNTVYGNGGNQTKLGSRARFENNTVTGNCDYFDGKSFSAMGSGVDTSLNPTDNCRASGDTVGFGNIDGDNASGSADTLVYNNTIIGRAGVMLIFGCMRSPCQNQINFSNNIFKGNDSYNHPGQPVGFIYTSGSPVTINYDYNLFHYINGSPCLGTHQVCTDPLLVKATLTDILTDPTTVDARLLATSPAKDAGTTLSGFSDDIVGNTRPVGPAWDIGAYEYVPLLISEFRLRGSAGASDEFVEIYNPSVEAATVQSADASSGYALAASNGVARFVIPNGTVIPSRGHYLGGNSSGYSLGSAASADMSYTSDIADNTGLALFSSSNSTNFTATYALDAVGFGSTASPYAEGTTLASIGTGNGEYSFIRKVPNTSTVPQDTNSNAGDFLFVSTTAGVFNGVQSILGAAGPENLTSPRLNNSVKVLLVSPFVSTNSAPNRAVITCGTEGAPACVSSESYLVLRRSFTNNTGANVTRLRFRFIDLTTLGNSGAGIAELHAVTSSTATIFDGVSGTVTVGGTTLETPPSQAIGGGINSTLSAPTVTLGTPLAPGASANFQLMTQKFSGGSFRFFFVVEALP